MEQNNDNTPTRIEYDAFKEFDYICTRVAQNTVAVIAFYMAADIVRKVSIAHVINILSKRA